MRKTFELNEIERAAFKRLRPIQDEAVSFWNRAAIRRRLDPESVISSSNTFSALPLGHDKHWCWPLHLKCRKKPASVEI